VFPHPVTETCEEIMGLAFLSPGRGLCLLAALASTTTHATPLGDALEQALARQPEAQALHARQDEQAALRSAAGGWLADAPALAVGYRSDQWTDDQGQREWEAELALPLWLPGERGARTALATAEGEVVAARLAALRLELAGTLRDALWDHAAARAALDLADQRLATAEQLEADVARRVAVGELARADLLLAQQETLTARAARLERQTVLEQKRRRFSLLTAGTEPPAATPESVAAALSLEQHPQLESARHEVAAAQGAVQVATAVRRAGPELSVFGRRERGNAVEPYHDSLGLRLSLPFSSTPRARAADAAAQAALTAALARYDQVRRQLGEEQAQAVAAHTTAATRLTLLEQARDLAQQRLALAEKAFALGEHSLLELLRTRSAAFDTAAALHEQQIALARAAAHLNQSHGVLP
jgi:cobalt-zinc-cadmium efflux system outer membrane protein